MSSHPVRFKKTKDVEEILFIDIYEISVRKKAVPGKLEKQLTI